MSDIVSGLAQNPGQLVAEPTAGRIVMFTGPHLHHVNAGKAEAPAIVVGVAGMFVNLQVFLDSTQGIAFEQNVPYRANTHENGVAVRGWRWPQRS